MGSYIIRRLLLIIPTLFAIMVVMVFVLIFFPDIATWLPDNLRQGPS